MPGNIQIEAQVLAFNTLLRIHGARVRFHEVLMSFAHVSAQKLNSTHPELTPGNEERIFGFICRFPGEIDHNLSSGGVFVGDEGRSW